MRPAAVTDFSQFASLRAGARSDSPEALRKTAQQFESLLTQQLLKNMRAASLGDDVLGGGQTQFYQDMFDQQLAQHLSAGRGLGIADLLVRQLQGREAESMTPAPEAGAEVSGPATIGRPMAAAAAMVQASGGHGPPYGAAAVVGRAAPAAAAAPPALRPPQPKPADFVQAVLPHAEKAAAELGVPAQVLVAQAALETGWGRHAIRRDDGRPTFNFFGIKADKRWRGQEVERMTQEYEHGRMQSQRADFRAYDSIGAAFADYVRFLQSNPRYADALRHGGDTQRFVSGLQKAGYATDPAYAQKILRVAEGPTMRRALAQISGSAPRTYTV